MIRPCPSRASGGALVQRLWLSLALGLLPGSAVGQEAVEGRADPGAATAPTRRPADQGRLAQVLSGYERMPGERYWRARGPETVRALQSLFGDEGRPAFVRLRAVRAASFYRTPAARSFLLSVARASGQKDLFVREALLGLGRAFRAEAGEAIAPFLDHLSPVVRGAAAEALGEIATERWGDALRRRQGAEADRGVRDALRNALERIEREKSRPPKP